MEDHVAQCQRVSQETIEPVKKPGFGKVGLVTRILENDLCSQAKDQSGAGIARPRFGDARQIAFDSVSARR